MKIITVKARRDCRIPNGKGGEVTKYQGEVFDLPEGYGPVPRYLEVVGEKDIPDAVVAGQKAADAAAQAKADAEEKAALLKKAAELGLKGIHPNIGLDNLRTKVEAEEIRLGLVVTPTGD